MAQTKLDPLARLIVYDEVDVSDLKYSSLDTVIKELAKYQQAGYEGFDVDYYDDYGSTVVTLKVTRQRLENDEEYTNRMEFMKANRECRRQEYLRLREEFANEEG